MAPRISVVIPMYNSAATIGDALASLHAMTFTDWEAICIDDASTDTTVDLVKGLIDADERIRLIELSENQGPSAARNRGMDEACGDYLAFLDSDDAYTPSAFERLIHLADTNNLDVLDYKGTAVYESKHAQDIRTETFEDRTPIDGVLSGAELFCKYQALGEYHCALYFHFIRRSYLDSIHLRLEEGIIHEDELFSPLLHAQARRTMFLNEALYVRHIHDGSLITAERGIANVSYLFTVQHKLTEWIARNANNYDDIFLEAFALRIFEMRQIMRDDMQRCSAQELEEFRESLSPNQRVEFSLVGTLEHAASIQAADTVRNSHSYQLGDALLQVPRMILGKPRH